MNLESLNSGSEGVSRRTAIKYGSVGAGLLVATPTILTLGATAASASGTVVGEDYESSAGSTDTSRSGLTIAASGLPSAGLFIGVYAIAENTGLGATNKANFSAITGWTKLGEFGTLSESFGSSLSVAVFGCNAVATVGEDPDTGDPITTYGFPNFTPAYSAGRANSGSPSTTPRPRVALVTQFRSASLATSSAAAAFGSVTSSTSSVSGSPSAVVGNSSIWLANLRLAGSTPSVTFPDGFTVNKGDFSDGGTATTRIGGSVGYKFPAGGYPIGAIPAQTVTLGSAVTTLSVALAIG